MYFDPTRSSFNSTLWRTYCVRRPNVRRRALLAFRALSAHDPELMKRVVPKIQKRLEDSEHSVVGAALLVAADVVRFTLKRIVLLC